MITEKFPTVLLGDIETDGLMAYSCIPGVTESSVVSKVHCIVLHDYHRNTYHRYRSDVPGDIEKALKRMMEADLNVGHNYCKYDVPVLELLYPWFKLDKKKVLDTLVLSRLLHANIKDTDNALLRQGVLPGKLYGSHSLKAWGYRVGENKGSYGEGAGDVWAEFNEDMLDYCELDVKVTRKVFDKMLSNAYYFSEDLSYTQYAVRLEHDAAWVLAQQERNGFPFHEKGAAKLYAELSGKRNDILQRVMETFGSWYVAKGGKESFKHPRTGAPLLKYPNVTYPKTGDIYTKAGKLAKVDYCAGRPYTPVEHIVFNPGSRQHIAKVLQERGWVPEEFTETGQPKVDEETLADAAERLPEEYRADVKLIAEYLLLVKRLGQLAEGDNAWLKLCNRGFIHGSVNPNGAVTGRATHAFPNIAQVPSGTALYGPECRALFGVAYVRHLPGWENAVQVGTDASGLELRCLGHFMAKFDGGEYIRTILEQDIHFKNVEALGLVPKGTERIKEGPGHEDHDKFRSYAKTFIYAFLYGAGDAKIGSIIPGGDKALGKDLKKRFMENTPAIAELRAMLEELLVESQKWVDGVAQVRWKRRWIKGLDGRKVHVRSPHAALNTLLQSAGALLCKFWVAETERILTEEMGLKHGWDGDFAYMAWVHDEMQIAARTPEIAEKIAEASQKAMRAAGDFFNFRCLLDTESKIGATWLDCH